MSSGIAHVRAQRRRHLGERLEQAGEDPRVGGRNRIAGIRQVDRGRAVVGVDDDLHRVADVVEPAAAGVEYG